MATTSLSHSALPRIPEAVTRPAYRREAVTPGIVHLGVGAFHRAHQAVYVDDRLAAEPEWGIIGVSLRRPDTRDALRPQDYLYTVSVRDNDRHSHRVIGSILDMLVAGDGAENVVESMARPEIRIVSLTVTEKGYCHDPASGRLNPDHPAIVADLANPKAPGSVPGLIAEAQRRRLARGLDLFTVMSCDNLPANGRTTARVVTEYASLVDEALARMLEDRHPFVSTMVDRIVPATTEEDRAALEAAAGYRDAWPVVTEPFRQWVIEDAFLSGRPDFAAAGAQFVGDVHPFETMKLRMLNGAHSTLAYLGCLSEHETVSEAMDNADLHSLVDAMMQREIAPTLSVTGIDLDDYRQALLDRFANRSLHHRTAQIAMDGSQKIPQRLLDTIRHRMAENRGYDRLALAVAGWIRFLGGRNEHGTAMPIDDPMAEIFAGLAARYLPDAAAFAGAVMDLEPVFGAELSADPAFRAEVSDLAVSLFRDGTGAVLSRFAAEAGDR